MANPSKHLITKDGNALRHDTLRFLGTSLMDGLLNKLLHSQDCKSGAFHVKVPKNYKYSVTKNVHDLKYEIIGHCED